MADIGIQRTILKGNRYGALDFFEPEHSLIITTKLHFTISFSSLFLFTYIPYQEQAQVRGNNVVRSRFSLQYYSSYDAYSFGTKMLLTPLCM